MKAKLVQAETMGAKAKPAKKKAAAKTAKRAPAKRKTVRKASGGGCCEQPPGVSRAPLASAPSAADQYGEKPRGGRGSKPRFERRRPRNRAHQYGRNQLGATPGMRRRPRRYGRTYMAKVFSLPPSLRDHKRCIDKLQRACFGGGSLRSPCLRGGGKLAWCRAGMSWSTSNGFRRYPYLIGANDSAAEKTLKALRTISLGSDPLLEDFPELFAPICAGAGQRAQSPRPTLSSSLDLAGMGLRTDPFTRAAPERRGGQALSRPFAGPACARRRVVGRPQRCS